MLNKFYILFLALKSLIVLLLLSLKTVLLLLSSMIVGCWQGWLYFLIRVVSGHTTTWLETFLFYFILYIFKKN